MYLLTPLGHDTKNVRVNTTEHCPVTCQQVPYHEITVLEHYCWKGENPMKVCMSVGRATPGKVNNGNDALATSSNIMFLPFH